MSSYGILPELRKGAARLTGSLFIATASIVSPVGSPLNTEADTGEKLTQNGVELTLLHPAKWDEVKPDRQIGVGIMRQGGADLDLARKVAQDYFFSSKPLDEYRDKFYLVDIDFTSGMPSFICNDRTAECENQELVRQTRDRVALLSGLELQETIVLMKSSNGVANGRASVESNSPALYTGAYLSIPDPLIDPIQKTTVSHEVGHSVFGFGHNEEPNSVMNTMESRGPNFGTRQSQIVREILSGNPVLRFLTPGPELNIVPTALASLQGDTKVLSSMDMVALMIAPLGTTELKWWVYPAPNIYTGKPDGPGIEMKYGDPVLIHALGKGGQRLPAPEMGKGNYIFLPDTTYTVGFSISGANVPLEWGSSRWGEIEIFPGQKIYVPSPEAKFRIPKRDATTITYETHKDGQVTNSKTPTLTWNNTKTDVFYYEVQVSKDRTFNMDPKTATTPVYSELIHGGLSAPLNSYKIPDQYPLEAGATYYWRVKPRIQGDGTPVEWPQLGNFKTSTDARVLSTEELEIITQAAPQEHKILSTEEHEKSEGIWYII